VKSGLCRVRIMDAVNEHALGVAETVAHWIGLELETLALGFVAVVHPLITAVLLVALLGSARRNRRLSRRLGKIRRAAQIALGRARSSGDEPGPGLRARV
jgi:hypothetical protein